MLKILLDTDIGGDIDDAICLAYLLNEPQCDLLGVTIVCGEPEKRASVADAICKAAGRSVPIVVGTDETLQPIPVYPTPGGAGALANWPHDSFEKGDAPAFMYRKIRENPHEVTLIAIGNLTNVAMLLRDYPDAAGLLKGLYVMNGYFGEEKLPHPMYNWNAWADPLASKMVFGADIACQRMLPLEITQQLTIDAKNAQAMLPASSGLMRAVYDFGNAWLESSNQLTLHDPLAAMCVFHPEICQFERGFVSVETEDVENMAATTFTPDAQGNVEIARTVDKDRFYQLLASALSGRKRTVPPKVAGRAIAAGEIGRKWLENLDALVDSLEQQWHIRVGNAMSGGSRAFVANAEGEDGAQYVLKVELPDNPEEEYLYGIHALQIADGHGYGKLYACDVEKRACLLERLGGTLNGSGIPAERQMEIICEALTDTWQMPVDGAKLNPGSVDWFRDFIDSMWEELQHPCSRRVIDQAMRCLDSRSAHLRPEEFVLLHGDAHNNNTLRVLSGEEKFKLIDPEGLFYEKAYDLGVLMREWPDEYMADPMRKGRERSELLSRLTGVDAQGIWDWGFVQMVSTSMVLLQIGEKPLAQQMLGIAEMWCQ